MSVYVDNMRAPFGRMRMSHLIADTSEELLAMVDRIGVDRKWIQKAGSAREHFDIAESKRALAVAAGAIAITWRQAGAMVHRREIEGVLGLPAEAEAWQLFNIRRPR